MAENQGKARHAATKGTSPDVAYYSPAQSRIPDFNFDRVNGPDRGFRVQRIDDGGLVGSSVFESALYTPSHIDTRVFQSLAQSMEVIEKKLHGGQYDAQAIPLIEAFLAELRELAQIQVERNEINDQRICDLKEANIAAYNAVCEARERREEGIEKARMYRFNRMSADFDKRAARAQMRDERKAAKEEAAREKDALREEARAAKEEASKVKRAEYAQRWEAWREAKEARRMRRYERQMQREQAKAEAEAKKWEKRLMKSEHDLEKARAEKDAKQAEDLARKAAAEAEMEIAKAKAKGAKALEERARLELERAQAAIPQKEAPVEGPSDAPTESEEPRSEAKDTRADSVPAEEAAAEKVPEVTDDSGDGIQGISPASEESEGEPLTLAAVPADADRTEEPSQDGES
ncbi:MAG: hypothetical protein HFJ72_06000 [Adlercreutzia sp.]|nr:hypothetical protein [Adlercreutzia sp.]